MINHKYLKTHAWYRIVVFGISHGTGTDYLSTGIVIGTGNSGPVPTTPLVPVVGTLVHVPVPSNNTIPYLWYYRSVLIKVLQDQLCTVVGVTAKRYGSRYLVPKWRYRTSLVPVLGKVDFLIHKTLYYICLYNLLIIVVDK